MLDSFGQTITKLVASVKQGDPGAETIQELLLPLVKRHASRSDTFSLNEVIETMAKKEASAL